MDPEIIECTWNEVRDQVKSANESLAQMIDDFNPSNEYTFYLAKYPFGSNILENGQMMLPVNEEILIPLSSIASEIKDNLSYSSVPMGLILNNTIEVYFETSERVMPSKIFKRGIFFGLWELFDAHYQTHVKKIWSLSAGARSIFLLPKISDAMHHARLKRDFGVICQEPRRLQDQIIVFRELAKKAPKPKDQWTTDILFFTKKWANFNDTDKNSLRLKNLWLNAAWDQSRNCRNQMDYNVAWEAFAKEASRKHLKSPPFLINTIKHLIAISEGSFPGFAPAMDDTVAPISLIQDCYVKSYGLKEYAPVIMTTANIAEVSNYVYYSHNMPTLLEWAPQGHIVRTIMSELRDIKTLMDLFIDTTKSKGLIYDYFHNEKDQFQEIKPTSQLAQDDPNLLYPKKYKNNQKFCENSQFFKGCIRIKKDMAFINVNYNV